MNQSFKPLQSNQPELTAQACEAAIYMHPSDVMNDPKLTPAEKRAVLRLVDFRRSERSRTRRRCASSIVALLEVDAIRQAVVLLDTSAADRIARLPSSGRRRSVLSKWLRKIIQRQG